jgi:hypothetical protein
MYFEDELYKLSSHFVWQKTLKSEYNNKKIFLSFKRKKEGTIFGDGLVSFMHCDRTEIPVSCRDSGNSGSNGRSKRWRKKSRSK